VEDNETEAEKLQEEQEEASVSETSNSDFHNMKKAAGMSTDLLGMRES
jgi:hypothetical protein